MEENNNRRNEIFSKSVRAGKRTYFFDVKATRSNEYYLTITESKRRMGDDGGPVYEKHKIFLFEEDFEKFLDAFHESINSLNGMEQTAPAENNKPHESPPKQEQEEEKPAKPSSFTDVRFEDLP